MKKISIIVPCYNVGEYLQVTVQSLLEQSCHDFELILVNDGSTDGTATECDRLAASDSRLKVLHQKNQGVVAARHNGFNASIGAIIMFVDGDDTLQQNALKQINEAFKVEEIDLVRFGYNKVDPALSLNRAENPTLTGVFNLDEILNLGISAFKGHCSSSIWDKAYARGLVERLFNELGAVRINHSEDMLFSIAAVVSAKRILFLGEPLYDYVKRPGSVVHSFNPRAIEAKEMYFAALQTFLARHRRGRRGNDFRKILELEANESVNYVLFNTLAYSPGFDTTLKAVSGLKKSLFFRYCQNRRGSRPLKQRIREVVIMVPVLAALVLVLAKRFR